jgi:MoaA/NifB/PqqE/SkfB family radical SAM enzyme
MSKHYLRIMNRIAELDAPITIEIASNGSTLIANRNLIERLGHRIRSFRISFDAATEETYAKIRRGGNWNNLLKNVKWLVGLEKFAVSSDFVLQDINYQEVPAYVELTDSLGIDLIRVQRMWDWGTWTSDEFAKHDVSSMTHPSRNHMLSILSGIDNPKFQNRWKIDGI